MKQIIAVTVLLFALNSYGLEVPRFTDPVVDLAQVLSQQESQDLSKKIRDYHQNTTNQLTLLIVPSLKGDSLEGFSMKVAESWKLGSKEKDNGILLLFSISDKKYRIEVGQGLEGYLTDAESSRIQREIKPFLKQNKYFEAMNQEIDLIIKTISKNSDPEVIAEKARETQARILESKRQKENFLVVFKFLVYLSCLIFVSFRLFNFFSFPSHVKKKRVELNKYKSVIRSKKEELKAKKAYDSLNRQYRKSEQSKLEDYETRESELSSQINRVQNDIFKIKELARKNGERV